MFEELDELTEQGYLRKVEEGDLVLYNYTVSCVYERLWNDATIHARGTVYNKNTGELVAKAFPKFFNFSELPEQEQRDILNRSYFRVFEKLDGVLGIIYHYNGKWNVNTRGSFSSEFAVYAEENILPKYNLDNVDTDTTLLVEIIYPGSRIIVDYEGAEKLVLIGAYNRKTGREVSIWTIDCNLPRPVVYSFTSIDDIITRQHELSSMEEGFVVQFEDGSRVKFKSIEYLNVARALKDFSKKSFWKAMSLETLLVPRDVVASIPEEFRKEAENFKFELECNARDVLVDIVADCEMVERDLGEMEITPEYRKALGLYLKSTDKIKHKNIIFSVLLGRSVNEYVWQEIEPKG